MKWLVLLVCCMLVGCSPLAAAEPEELSVSPTGASLASELTVMLHIYSGMPDPRWGLDAGQTAELEALLETLPESVAVPEPTQLGFRGFLVGREGGAPSYLRAFGGFVRVEDEGEERWLADPERQVERWLFASGEAVLDPALLELLRPEFAPLPGVFAIYLTEDRVRPGDLDAYALDDLPLQPEPLLTDGDLLAYDGVSHTFTLRPERALALTPVTIPTSGRAFVLCVGEERIYAGGFWTPFSSLSFDGIVIEPALVEGEHAWRIALGYPGPDFFRGEDPRSDARVLEALRVQGLLDGRK